MDKWRCLLCHRDDVPRSKAKRDLCDDCVPGLAARGLAWCTRGKHRVASGDIAPSKRWCRACERARMGPHRDRAEYGKAWRAANQDKIAAYNAQPRVREWRRKNANERYWRNPEKARAAARASYSRLREKKIISARLWRIANRQLSRDNARLGRLRKGGGVSPFGKPGFWLARGVL